MWVYQVMNFMGIMASPSDIIEIIGGIREEGLS